MATSNHTRRTMLGATAASTAAPALSIERQPSPIMAMHQRYEEAMAEYNVVDDADLQLGGDNADKQLGRSYLDAKRTNAAETTALRVAILYQVPDSWVDAMILQFHIYVATDMAVNDSINEEERNGLTIAIGTLFDFLCCEVRQDHESLGGQFQSSAQLAFFRRRYRTGIVED